MSSLAELLSLRDAARQAQRERPTVPLALATLVAVDGSSYRQPGARMLCDAQGRVLAGAISGGCLEADVAQRAKDVCASGASTVTAYDLREDLETIWGFGTGCDGVAHVLLSPWVSASASSMAAATDTVNDTVTDTATETAIDAAIAAASARESGVLLTVVTSANASRVGHTTFIANGDATAHDSITRTVMRTHAPLLAAHNGEQLFAASVQPPPHLLVVGASRGAEAFAHIAVATGWRITIVDHREAALQELTLPKQTQRIAIHPESAAQMLTRERGLNDARTGIALCTHRFEHDLAWLSAALSTSVQYIGLLGSRQRAAQLMRALGDAGITLRARDRARIFAPVGLDIGGDSPQSIALAAIAEMHAVLHARPAGSLRERQMPLHTRTATPDLGADAADVSCALPVRHTRPPRKEVM